MGRPRKKPVEPAPITADPGEKEWTHADVYPAKDGYRWHLKAGNGEIVAESGEAYIDWRDATDACRRATGAREVNHIWE